ncbi:FAD-dependent oxidoreductase [bacterium]|nr:FAD-dependent oxidoreductase [bacterium]
MISETLVEREKYKPRNYEDFDLIVIGAGPGGMSAALCACRAKLKTLIIERAVPGGQASTAYIVDNLLGFPGGVLGDTIGRRMEEHLEGHGCYVSFETVEDIESISDREKAVRTNMGHTYKAKAIIISVGLEPQKLDQPFESKFLGRGISYYAQGDASFYQGKDVAVIGGGNCACYAAEYLSQFVNQLYLIHQSDSIKAVRALKEKIVHNPKIQIVWDSKLVDVFGIDKVEKVKIQNSITDQHTWIDVKGVFVYTGRIPPREILNLNLESDAKGFIITDEYMRTNLQGIYAVGDIRSKQVRQIATAVSDGMIAAVNVERDLQRINK